MSNCPFDDVVFFGLSVASKRLLATVAGLNNRDETAGQATGKESWGRTICDRSHLFESKGTGLYVAAILLDTCINLLDLANAETAEQK